METVRRVQKWATTATNAIDSEDAKLVEQVSTLHSQMVQWMVQMLLRLAPDWKDNSQEAKDMALRGSLSLNQLHTNVKTLFEQLESFSDYVALCCNGIVMDNTQQRRDNMDDNADHELKDLHRLRTECEDWINTAKILTVQLLGESMESLFPVPVQNDERASRQRTMSTLSTDADYAYHDKEKTEKPSETEKPPPLTEKPEGPEQQKSEKQEQKEEKKEAPPQEPSSVEPEPQQQQQTESEKKETTVSAPAPAERIVTGERLEVIGQDDNTHITRLDDSSELAPPSGDQTAVQKQTDGTPDTQKAFEALEAVNTLQDQLLQTEERAQAAEERASAAEAELASSQEKIRELEKRLAKLEQDSTKDDKSSGAPSKVASPVVPHTPSKEPTETKEEKKRPESQASKASSTKSSKSKKK